MSLRLNTASMREITTNPTIAAITSMIRGSRRDRSLLTAVPISRSYLSESLIRVYSSKNMDFIDVSVYVGWLFCGFVTLTRIFII